ncbi:MAG TPA: hypothetical protein VL403_09340, partial [Candidatus Kryptonia bacterium]|nr:hypothetical protein [Candidatus Kryptonia bacterium]
MGRRIRLLLLLLLVIMVAGLLGRAWLGSTRIRPGSFLLVDVGGAYAEAPPSDLLARLLWRREPTLIELLTLLKGAAADARLAGVALHITKLDIGWAKAQEIRDAIGRLKQSGKQV